MIILSAFLFLWYIISNMLKRNGFKTKTYEEKLEAQKSSALRKKPMNKQSTLSRSKTPKKGQISKKKAISNPISKLKKQLWELCKQIIRKKYGNTCYTCGKTGLSGAGWHTGHFLASSVCGAYLRHDLRNLRPQCYYCNINLGGSGAIFYQKLVEREGQQYIDDLFKDKQKTIKADAIWYQQKIDEYEKLAL